MTRDVSVSGLCLITEQHLEVGERMEVTLTMEDLDAIEKPAQVQLTLQSRVVWVDSGSGAAGLQAGLQVLLDEGSSRLVWAFKH